MVGLIRRIRIFLSSPGNLEKDRQKVRDVVAGINQDSGQRDGFFVELVEWATHTWPAAGSSPQAVINDHLPSDIDIYLGMMGAYFGTPTQRWGSGTEEEFRISYSSWKKTGSPEIMFYFSESLTSIKEINLDQLAARTKFKSEFKDLGILYEEYSDDVKLSLVLHRQLSSVVYRLLQNERDETTSLAAPDESFSLLRNLTTLIKEHPLVAADDLARQSVTRMIAHTRELNSLNSEVVKLRATTEKATKRFAHAQRTSNPATIASTIKDLVIGLQRYQLTLTEKIPLLHNAFEDSIMFIQRAITIVKNHKLQSTMPYGNLVEPMAALRSSLEGARPPLELLSNEIKKWPFPDGDLRIQQLRIIALHADLDAYLLRAIGLLDEFNSQLVSG